jgi:RNA polymerase-binding protein DksA
MPPVGDDDGDARSAAASGIRQAMAKTQKSRKDLKPIEDALLIEQESLTRQIAEIEARYSDENANQARTADEGEPETITTDRERDLSLLENARDLLDQVERALRKIADGTYGRCANCGKAIEAARLKALPHASLCIACKRAEERH